jgi:hypothetical protein
MDDTDWDGLIARRERLLNEALLGKRAHEQVRQSRLQRGEACIHCGHFPKTMCAWIRPTKCPAFSLDSIAMRLVQRAIPRST